MTIFWTIILFAVSLCACTTEQPPQPTDQLLAGTTWEYSIIERRPDSSTPTIESWINDANLLNVLNELQIPYEITERSAEGCDTIKNIVHKCLASLTFSNDKCLYESSEQTADSIISYTKYWKVFHLEAGEYNNPNSLLNATITTDKLLLYTSTSPIAEMDLEDGTIAFYNGREETDGQLLTTSTQQHYEFSYQREGNDIYLQNDNLKWVGLLNRSEWTIEVVQIQPERKTIHTFELQ